VITSSLLSNVRHSTQISCSDSSSEHLNVLAPVPAPEQFGPKNQKKHRIICITRLFHKLSGSGTQISGFGSSHPKLLRLRLHTTAAY